jgi:hypothetical protein
MVATTETIKESARQVKDHVVGEDEETYAGHILTFQLSTTYVPAASKSTTRKQIGGRIYYRIDAARASLW